MSRSRQGWSRLRSCAGYRLPALVHSRGSSRFSFTAVPYAVLASTLLFVFGH